MLTFFKEVLLCTAFGIYSTNRMASFSMVGELRFATHILNTAIT